MTAHFKLYLDIGGMLVHSVLKSNQIAQHVISDVGKTKQNGTGRPIMQIVTIRRVHFNY